MDEPTVGLHFHGVKLLLDQLQSLVSQGTTIIIVEHDQLVIDAADWVLEIGPGAGEKGGQLLFEGPASQHSVGRRARSDRPAAVTD